VLRDARIARKAHVALFLGILAFAQMWTLWRGQDVNWDFQNYHDYDALALLHRRSVADVAPAGSQSYLNPLPYLLPYILRHRMPPIAAGMLVAASQALALMLAWLVACACAPGALLALIATIAAISGSMVLTELGTSFSDLVLTIPILAAILMMCRMPALKLPRSGAFLVLAGLFAGFAIGVKPTNVLFAPALAVFAVMRQGAPQRYLPAMISLAAGLAFGALLSDGAWAWFLWRTYGSPIFPFLNTVFRSTSAALVDFGDPRYRYTGLLDALETPFRVAIGPISTGEVPIRDARIAFGISLGILQLATRNFWRSGWQPELLDALSAFVVVGTAAWLLLCPVQRYAIGLEIVSGLITVLIVARLPGRIGSVFAPIA